MKVFELYNGVKIPTLFNGPGIMPSPYSLPFFSDRSLINRAWRKVVTAPCRRAMFIKNVASCFVAGFRGLDYSAAYGRGDLIADAIELSGIPRREIFLTGRVSNGAQRGGRAAVREQIRNILLEYRTNCVDLLMFHWPVTGHYEDTWREICAAYDAGLARAVGVANCHQHHLERLVKCGIKPMLDQFEVHPLFTQKPLIMYCKEQGIQVESYTPIARKDSRLFRLPLLNAIAAAHGKSVAQVILRWHIQQGLIPVVRSNNPRRQVENCAIYDFTLTADEMKTIDGFNINSRLRYDPDNCDFTIL